MLDKIKKILNSVKFWEVLIMATIAYLEAKGWVGEAERNLVLAILGPSVLIDTVQGTAEKLKG